MLSVGVVAVNRTRFCVNFFDLALQPASCYSNNLIFECVAVRAVPMCWSFDTFLRRMNDSENAGS